MIPADSFWIPTVYRRYVRPWVPSRIRETIVKFLNGPAARFGHLRTKRWTTRLLGFEYHRALRRIEIDITYACNLACFNCDRSCTQAPTGEHMTLKQIDRFVRESIAAEIQWERIRLLGGEPTLHPQIKEILRLLLWYRRHFSSATVIEITTNGCGEKVRSVLQSISPEIQIDNTQKQRDVQPAFNTFNVAPKDLRAYHSSDFRNACIISHRCGIGLTPYGYYPCAVAGGIDRIVGWDRGRKSLPSDTDDMDDLLEAFCSHCGHFKRHQENYVVNPVMSSTWRKAYDRYRQRRPRLTLYASEGASTSLAEAAESKE
jgi:hypothetical protein